MSQQNYVMNLQELSLKELKVVAKNANLRVSGMRKSEIIASIKARNNNDQQEVGKIREAFKSRSLRAFSTASQGVCSRIRGFFQILKVLVVIFRLELQRIEFLRGHLCSKTILVVDLTE